MYFSLFLQAFGHKENFSMYQASKWRASSSGVVTYFGLTGSYHGNFKNLSEISVISARPTPILKLASFWSVKFVCSLKLAWVSSKAKFIASAISKSSRVTVWSAKWEVSLASRVLPPFVTLHSGWWSLASATLDTRTTKAWHYSKVSNWKTLCKEFRSVSHPSVPPRAMMFSMIFLFISCNSALHCSLKRACFY